MNPTDEELDRDWKPSGRRPQSTMARSFSAELMDIFRIENDVVDLDQKLDKRKQDVNQRATELEALERRIREMEDRLRRSQAGGAQSGSPRAQRPAVGASTFDQQSAPAPPQKDLPQRLASSRPGTAKSQQQAQQQQVHGGAMPPTPTASEDGEDPDS